MRKKEIENNDRYIYINLPLVQIYTLVRSIIFIFRNLYWTNLAWLTILKCGKSERCREIGNVLPARQILAILSS